MHISKRTVLVCAVLAAALAALVGAAAGVTAPKKEPPAAPANFKAVLAQVKGLKVADREAKLAELAKAEGQVNVYTSLSSLVVKPLQAAWAQTYPDVKLNLYRASSEDVTAKVLAEVGANTSGADVIETNGTNMLIFQHKKNVLIPYRSSPFAVQVPKK